MNDEPQNTREAVVRALTGAETGLTAHQPHVADWAGPVRRRLRRRRAANGAAAVLLVFGAVGAAATVLSAAGGESDNLVAAAPSDSPAPSPSASAPAPGPSPASPSASPVPATSPQPAGSAPAAAPDPVAPSYPPYGSQQITLTAQVSNPRPQAGQEIVVEVVATGHAEHEPFLQGPRIDDSGPGWIVGTCVAPLDSSPPPARDQRVSKTVRHTFDEPGRHTMVFRADSACSYYRGSDEITVVIDVEPAPSTTPDAAAN